MTDNHESEGDTPAELAALKIGMSAESPTRATSTKPKSFRRFTADTRPLANPFYRRLFLGQGLAFIGFQITAVAVAVQVFDITRSSFWVGALGLAGLIPLIIFGLWGGAIADARDRRKVLLVASTVIWVGTLLLLIQALLSWNNVWVLVGLVAVQSAGFAVASPTRQAIIPRLLPTELVPAANTLNFTVMSAAMVLGPLIAGLLLARWNYSAAYAVDAVLFTMALYSAARLPSLPPISGLVSPGWRSVVDGLQFLVKSPVLLMSFAVDIVAMVFAMPRALFPEVAETRFGGESSVGWLFAAIAIGAVIGGLFSGWITRVRRQGVALVGAIVAWGLAVATAGVVHSLLLVVFFLAVAGVADLVSAVFRQTILQVYAPDEMRGRLQGVFVVVVAGGPRLGDLRAGSTAAVVGATASWVGGGIACVIIVLLLAAFVPVLWRYRITPSPAH